MPKFKTELDEKLTAFIRRQSVFFTASAAASGRINLSPKGLDSLRVIDPATVVYLDLTGSGNETAAHIKNDGRLTIMLCAFEKEPLILRLYGRGEVVAPDAPKWAGLIAEFDPLPGSRQLIMLHIESVQTSCGFGVPEMQLVQPRTMLRDWATRKGESGIADYRRKNNRVSIDGFETGLTDPEPVG